MYIFLSFDNVNEEDVTGFIVLSLRLKILSILLNRRQTYVQVTTNIQQPDSAAADNRNEDDQQGHGQNDARQHHVRVRVQRQHLHIQN